MPHRSVDPEELIRRAPMSESLRALARRGEPRLVRRGTQLIVEGDIGDTIYIVLEGRLRAYSVDLSGHEVTYVRYGPGEFVGELGLDGGARVSNVEAEQGGIVVAVRRAHLDAHLHADPHFAFELLSKVIARARATSLKMREIALNTVYGRLKRLLEELAAPQPDGTRLIDPAPSQQEVAQELGCSRGMIARLMADLERGGCVRVGRRRVVICKALPAKW
jgi:CRP/FNR family cyclic AMP-dependent transcriptional regulator